MDAQSGVSKSTGGKFSGVNALGQDSGWNAHNNRPVEINRPTDAGGASRFFNRLPIEEDDLVPFFYTPKASRSERNAGMPEGTVCSHPTVKPISIMEWCLTLVAREGTVVLDPFMGSGTTGIAAVRCKVNFVGIEREEEYLRIAEARIRHHGGDPEKA